LTGPRRRADNAVDSLAGEVEGLTGSVVADPAGEAREPEPDARRLGRGVAIALFLGIGGNAVVYIQYSSTVALAVYKAHGAVAYAALLIVNGGLVIVSELPLTTFTRRLRWRLSLVAGTALMSVGIAMAGAFEPFALMVVAWLIWTLGEMLFSPVVM